ncbi:Type 1 phosphatases regulator ypi1 [Didymella heteroderae]|uniref:Type 1 phosphatases regulator n=1 Tax=Didymella heteroderae TaxID=1769908 RepID=A0A9P4WQ12_9PLEO|nr:Type 1 phosphatases regulator ypi1 [Didymella heteroderae]
MSNVPSRTATPSRDTGSHTIQQTQPNPVLRISAPSGVLRLRAEPEERRRIQWAEDVVDNEGMGKKSSKGEASGKSKRQPKRAPSPNAYEKIPKPRK